MFEQRLDELEQRLEHNPDGNPDLYFLAGLEREFSLEDTASPNNSPEEVSSRQAQMRAEAAAMINNLAPTTEQETQKKDTWLASARAFTIEDCINFELYREFSQPTLQPTDVPRGATYEDLTHQTSSSEWLEFRFGNGLLQEGYYDNAGMSEIRLQPCPPSELVRRQALVESRLQQIASQYNKGVSEHGGTHINLSMYEEAADGNRRPILGTDDARRDNTLAALAGVSAAIQEGVWMNSTTTDEDYYNDVVSVIPYDISQFRTSVRVQNDYIELRDQALHTTTAHGLLWMMAGLAKGREAGVESIKSAGFEVPHIVEKIIPQRTEQYSKSDHVELLRAIEQSSFDEEGVLRLAPMHAVQKSHAFLSEILGRKANDYTNSETSVLSMFLMACTKIDANGSLFVDPNQMATAIISSTREEAQIITSLTNFNEVVAEYKQYLTQDAVRVTTAKVIESHPRLAPLTLPERRERLMNSAIMQSAYDTALPAFVGQIGIANIPVEAPTYPL